MRMSRKELRNAVDLTLRRTDGRTFQAFFGRVMKAKYGDRYQTTSADYTQGDLKCDGLLLDPLTIHACYGPLNAGHDQSDKTTQAMADKVTEDFEGALAQWPKMRGWIFVHSFIDTPPHFLRKIHALKEKYPQVAIELYGHDRFVGDIESLQDDAIDDLVGSAALHEAVKNLRPKEVLDLVDAIMAHAPSDTEFDEAPKVVPSHKIEFNKLTGKHKDLLVSAYASSKRVEQIIKGHPDPELQRRLASAFRAKYDEYDFQGFEPNEILDKLIAFAMSGEDYSVERNAAAVSVVAYLFQLCSIYKEPPGEVAA